MKTIINTIASFLIVVGIIAMAGSANDCDGACMDTANTLGEQLRQSSMILLSGGLTPDCHVAIISAHSRSGVDRLKHPGHRITYLRAKIPVENSVKNPVKIESNHWP